MVKYAHKEYCRVKQSFSPYQRKSLLTVLRTDSKLSDAPDFVFPSGGRVN